MNDDKCRGCGKPEMADQLTKAERKRLAKLEATVELSLDSVWEMAQALHAIHRGRLYRETHATFEEYFRERWARTPRRGYQLINWAEVRTKVPIPISEHEARDLAGLTPAELAAYAQARQELEHAAALEQLAAVNAGEQKGLKLAAEIGRGDCLGAIRKHAARIEQHAKKMRTQHFKLTDIADQADAALRLVLERLGDYVLVIESTGERQAA